MRDAVSAVFIHQDEILVIKRQNHLNAFPGYFAFPGGKIEEFDKEKKSGNQFGIDNTDFNCLVREIKEELHFDLLNSPNIKNISVLGTSKSPDFNPHRFDTRFVRIDLTQKMEFSFDENEISEILWLKPQEFLNRYREGEFLVVPPIYRAVKSLSDDLNFAGGYEHFFGYFKIHETEMMEAIFGIHQFMPKSKTLPPAERTNAFLIEDTLIDPSPRDEHEYQNLLFSLKNYQLKQIIITHHHPDHYEFSNRLAKELGISIALSTYTKHAIEKKHNSYFEKIHLQILKEGDVAFRWNEKDIFTYEIPGHDEGQLGFAPKTMEWFIVGDLIQGIGTVVIGEPEGDMQKYFDTLERVIHLRPNVIMPSHGIPLGGVFRLEKTLEHRKMREREIKKLYDEGKNPDEILESVYKNLPLELKRFALKNIMAHLKKIENDQNNGHQ